MRSDYSICPIPEEIRQSEDTQDQTARIEESQDETVTSIVTGSEWADRLPEDAQIGMANTRANELCFAGFEEMIY